MLTESMKDQLRAQADLSDREAWFGIDPSMKDWIAAEKPYLWCRKVVVIDEGETITLVRDIGYGTLALFRGETLEGLGINQILTPDGKYMGVDTYAGEPPQLYKRIA